MSVSRMPRPLHLSIVVLAFLLAACVTSPSRPPEWVQAPPPASPEARALVVYGTAERLEDARAMAARDLERQVTQLLARLEPDAPAEQIEQIAAGRADQLQPLDEYVARDRIDTVEVYRLYEYDALIRQRDRQALSDRGTGATDPVEAPGGDALSRLRERIEAPVPPAATARERELAAMLQLASGVELRLTPSRGSLALDAAVPLQVELLLRDAGTGEPFAGVPLAIEVEYPLVDGEREVERLLRTSSPQGAVVIELPPPRLAGTMRLSAEPVWLAPEIDRWRVGASDDVTALRVDQLTGSLRDQTQVRITSEAPGIPTAVVLVDRDIAGNPIGTSDAARGMLQEFGELGFRVRRVDLSPAERDALLGRSNLGVDDLYDILPFEVLSQVDRVIVGDVHIREFTEDEGFSVAVEVAAAAYDLRRDRVLARQAFEERISGSDARATIRAAFQVAGRRLVRRMAPRLP